MVENPKRTRVKKWVHLIPQFLLVGGSFNPFEKYQSKSEFSPNRGEDKTCLKPTPSFGIELGLRFFTRLLPGIGCCFNNTADGSEIRPSQVEVGSFFP